MSTIIDYKLQRHYKHILKITNSIEELKSQYYCGSQVLKPADEIPAVYVSSNGEDSAFYGLTTCKNTWSCPICSVREMSKHANDISCAIDALDYWHHQSAAMITLTILHVKYMTAEDVEWILRKTWKDFTIHGNGKQKANPKDVFASFCRTFNSTHRIRVGEATHGKNGFHFHYHCLFWFPSHRLQEIKQWEEQLETRWNALAKKNTLKLWAKKYPEGVKNGANEAKVNKIYEHADCKGSHGLYISKDEKGNVIKQESSHYICGWGADKELTGNFQQKASQMGHRTPHQILEDFAKTGDMEDAYLYLEFAKATKGKTRINFSIHSGIKSIIAKWKQTNMYMRVLQKKSIDLDRKKWKVICWLRESQWSEILRLETTTEPMIKQNILNLAKEEDGKKRITEYLEQFHIYISINDFLPNERIKVIEKMIQSA